MIQKTPKAQVQVHPIAITATPRWILPEPGSFKINVDGVVSRYGMRGSFSAVARSETGDYIGSSTVMIEGLNDPEILETLACREG